MKCETCPFMTLPDYLRETMLALMKLEEASTAKDVAEITMKARAVESANLNELVRLRYVEKHRRLEKIKRKSGNPRKVYFSINLEMPQK